MRRKEREKTRRDQNNCTVMAQRYTKKKLMKKMKMIAMRLTGSHQSLVRCWWHWHYPVPAPSVSLVLSHQRRHDHLFAWDLLKAAF